MATTLGLPSAITACRLTAHRSLCICNQRTHGQVASSKNLGTSSAQFRSPVHRIALGITPRRPALTCRRSAAVCSSTATRTALGGEGIVLPLGKPGAWDDACVGASVVRRFFTEEGARWHIYYTGKSTKDTVSPSGNPVLDMSTGCIGVASSLNGVHWSRGEGELDMSELEEGVVLQPDKNWWTFDTRHVGVSTLTLMASDKVRSAGNVHWMYYWGGNGEATKVPDNYAAIMGLEAGAKVEGLLMRAGVALSQDGKHFARVEGEYPSGAVLDVGKEGEWDALYVATPQVVFRRLGEINMYYHSFDVAKGKFTIGLARSRDGFKFSKHGPILTHGPPGSFDEMGCLACCVLPDPTGKTWLMYYEGLAADGVRGIGLATSTDGVTWARQLDKPVLGRGAPGSFDEWGQGSPCLVPMGRDSCRLYYTGYSRAEAGGRALASGIGMAESVDKEFKTFARHKNINPLA
eukprot:jgi/Mesvir1/9406/Mv01510-RA.1